MIAPQLAAAPARLSLQTPFGQPVDWARVGLATDIGDSHPLNDDRCLVLSSSGVGGGGADFLLCVLADGATGSTFATTGEPAGWRASQLAQAVLLETFVHSRGDQPDVLDSLKLAVRAADAVLAECAEGQLSSTLTALYLEPDGTAYGAGVGDSTLLVLPPRRRTPAARRLKKLGYEGSLAVGSAATLPDAAYATQAIEQWWPDSDGDGTRTRLEQGTYLVLLSDGIADSLPTASVDQLTRRHPVEQLPHALIHATREQRLEKRRREGAPTSETGLDNMSAIVVRFDGRRAGASRASPGGSRSTPGGPGALVCALGCYGGPWASVGGEFALACLAEAPAMRQVVPGCIAAYLLSEHAGSVQVRLESAFEQAATPFAAVAVDRSGGSGSTSGGGANVHVELG